MKNPNFIKELIGLTWSAWINKQLNSQTDRDARENILLKCDRHPELLKRVAQTVTVDTKFNFKIKCDRADYIGRKIIANGTWEPLIADTIASIVRPHDLCIDVGANIGFDTLVMSFAAGHEGRVLAFEPDWTNIKYLVDNLQLNFSSNVQILSIGLGDTFATGLLDTTGERGRSNIRPMIDTNERKERLHQSITVIPLSALLDSDKSKQIRLIKLDIEGLEYKALTGAYPLLNRVDAVICEIDAHYLAECGDTPGAIFSLMHSAGFRSYCAEPESTGRWVEGNEDFVHNKFYRSGHKPFDALFLREENVDTNHMKKLRLIE